MAKSIRSKWRRKCRAIKRERYGKKELERLKKTLGIDQDSDKQNIEMCDVSKIATVKKANEITTSKSEDNEMETDATKRIFNPKTLKDQHGSYPIWVHPRKIMKKSKKGKKGKGKKRRN